MKIKIKRKEISKFSLSLISEYLDEEDEITVLSIKNMPVPIGLGNSHKLCQIKTENGHSITLYRKNFTIKRKTFQSKPHSHPLTPIFA